jgi:hypothetical protein
MAGTGGAIPAMPPPGSTLVADYGAVCDGVTNDTAAFVAASEKINEAGGGTLWLPPGGVTCVVGAQTFEAGSGYSTSPIISIHDCPDEVTIYGNGARLRAADGLRFGSFDPQTGEPYTPPSLPFTTFPYGASAYVMVHLQRNASVSVADIELDGNIDGLILGGQYGDVGIQLPAFGVIAYSNKNLAIKNVHAHHHGTDGIMVGFPGLTEQSEPTPTILEDVVSEYNARQGFSWVGGIGMTVRRSKFTSSGRARFSSPPGAGVDIEAEESVIRDGLFEDCEIANNVGVGLVADSGDSARITVRDSSIWGNSAWSIWPLKPYMRFERCDIHGAAVNLYGSTTEPDSAAKFVGCSPLRSPSQARCTCAARARSFVIVDRWPLGTSRGSEVTSENANTRGRCERAVSSVQTITNARELCGLEHCRQRCRQHIAASIVPARVVESATSRPHAVLRTRGREPSPWPCDQSRMSAANSCNRMRASPH